MNSIVADGPLRLAASEEYQARRREVRQTVAARYAAELCRRHHANVRCFALFRIPGGLLAQAGHADSAIAHERVYQWVDVPRSSRGMRVKVTG